MGEEGSQRLVRGAETTRLDTFVDAAFAFGSTVLLISSGDLPSNYEELLELLRDIPSFVLSFFTLMIFWLSHREWSRTYGLENRLTIGFTLLLVLTVLVYIYPLKLMYGSLVHVVSGGQLGMTAGLNTAQRALAMMQLYGAGFTILSISMLGLFVATLRATFTPALTASERQDARIGCGIWGVLTSVGLLATLCAMLLPPRFAIWSGFLYWLLAPGIPLAIRYLRSPKRDAVD